MYLIVSYLIALLKETKKSRVVFVSSLLAFTNDLKSGDTINRLTKLPHFDETFNYGNSKAAMLASVNIFAERFKQHGVLVAASHPGIVDTGIFTTCVTNTKKNDFKMRLFYGFIFIIVKLVGKVSPKSQNIASQIKTIYAIFRHQLKVFKAHCTVLWHPKCNLVLSSLIA